ncbi:MAG: thioredoxin domain-containing protein [Acidobacteria bacterium]|nr:thioredoxin domain-containing protein [Acidobacteriota bacterium]
MSKVVRRILLLLTLVGLASSLASLYVHVQLLRQPGYVSFCDVNAAVSCTQVYQSQYANVAGVPVALFGALWYAGVMVLLAGSRWGWPSLRESAVGYVFVLSVLGLGAVLYFAYASLVILKIVCAMCIITYVAVTGVFLTSGARIPFPMITIPRRCWQDFRTALTSPSAIGVVLVFIASSTAAIAFMPRHGELQASPVQQAGGDRTSEFIRFWESQPRVQVPVPAEGASVVIVKFSDYMCPACAQSYLDDKPILAKYRAEYAGVVKFITKDYPLETECNANLRQDLHLASCESAVAVRLARLKGRGDAMEDWLYTRNQALTPPIVRQAARDIGGVPDFDEQYQLVLNQVKSDIGLATILGINRTPTFFIGHRDPGTDTVVYVRNEGALPPQYFELALQYELKKAGKIKP